MSAARTRCDRTSAWGRLQAHYDAAGRDFDLRQAFAADPQRFGAFSQPAPHLFADLSKNLIDAKTEALLLALAREAGIEAHRDAMFAGEHINATEDRAVLHTLLRAPASTAVPPALAGELAQVHATLDAMLAYAEQVRTDHTITDVVNIGIGGSDLGPQMAVRALDPQAAKAREIPRIAYDEADFRFALNEDAMATEKLAEGIRAFAVDAGKLDKMIEGLAR